MKINKVEVAPSRLLGHLVGVEACRVLLTYVQPQRPRGLLHRSAAAATALSASRTCVRVGVRQANAGRFALATASSLNAAPTLGGSEPEERAGGMPDPASGAASRDRLLTAAHCGGGVLESAAAVR